MGNTSSAQQDQTELDRHIAQYHKNKKGEPDKAASGTYDPLGTQFSIYDELPDNP